MGGQDILLTHVDLKGTIDKQLIIIHSIKNEEEEIDEMSYATKTMMTVIIAAVSLSTRKPNRATTCNAMM